TVGAVEPLDPPLPPLQGGESHAPRGRNEPGRVRGGLRFPLCKGGVRGGQHAGRAQSKRSALWTGLAAQRTAAQRSTREGDSLAGASGVYRTRTRAGNSIHAQSAGS